MVGERIRYYRKRQKMTLRELGEKSGFENRGDVRIAIRKWFKSSKDGNVEQDCKGTWHSAGRIIL